jgi:peptidoglycan/LPS O-acetylase OafA/YrhL
VAFISKVDGAEVGSKIIPLEALRGAAALVVVIHHFFLGFLPYYHGILPGTLSESALVGSPAFVMINGTGAVVVFFVLSGYVLSLKGRRHDAISAILDTALKRWLRLMPLVLISVMVSCGLFHLGLNYHDAAGRLSGSDWLSKFAYSSLSPGEIPSFSAAFAQGFYRTFFLGESYLNTSLWTMWIEFEASYIVLSLALLIRSKAAWALLGLVPMLGWWLLFNNTWLFPFILGMALAVFPLANIRISRTLTFVLLGIGLYLCGYFFPINHYSWASYLPLPDIQRQVLLLGIGASFLVFVFGTRNILTEMSQGVFARLLGKISFPLYLMHVLVICSVCSWIYATMDSGVLRITLTALALPLTLVLPVWLMSLSDSWWLSLLRTWKISIGR